MSDLCCGVMLWCPFFSTSAQDIQLQPSDNSTEATEWSPDLMRTQYEWLFINMTVTANNASDLVGQDNLCSDDGH